MRTLPLIGILLGFSAVSFADTYTFNDPFTTNDSCGNSSCDVIGDRTQFDIQKATFSVTGNQVTADLFFNFGPSNNLSSFSLNNTKLSPGDLFFTVNGAISYGVALTDHSGSVTYGYSDPNGTSTAYGYLLDAGDLYAVNSASGGLLTAQDVLNNPSGMTYRNSTDVWLRNLNNSISNVGNGTVKVTSLGGTGTTTPKLDVTLTFTASNSFLQAYNAGTLGFQFESATCANDVITGSFTKTPEPMSMMLVGGGLSMLGLIRKLRRA